MPKGTSKNCIHIQLETENQIIFIYLCSSKTPIGWMEGFEKKLQNVTFWRRGGLVIYHDLHFLLKSQNSRIFSRY